MKDKSVEGIKLELKEGLTKAAVFMQTTNGLPLEYFNDKLRKMDILQQLLFYMNFRNEHPDIFETNENHNKNL